MRGRGERLRVSRLRSASVAASEGELEACPCRLCILNTRARGLFIKFFNYQPGEIHTEYGGGVCKCPVGILSGCGTLSVGESFRRIDALEFSPGPYTLSFETLTESAGQGAALDFGKLRNIHHCAVKLESGTHG